MFSIILFESARLCKVWSPVDMCSQQAPHSQHIPGGLSEGGWCSPAWCAGCCVAGWLRALVAPRPAPASLATLRRRTASLCRAFMSSRIATLALATSDALAG